MKLTGIMLVSLALAGCATDSQRNTAGNLEGESSPSRTSAGASGSGATGSTADATTSGAAGSMASGSTGTMGSSGTMASSGSSSSANWDGVVQSIDRADSSMTAGGAAGATAAGSGSGYRVTVKRSDGTTQTINVDSMPSYRVGDSVRYSNGSLSSSSR